MRALLEAIPKSYLGMASTYLLLVLFISEAMYPPAKPLSIFTTLTPDAQLLSIVNSAATPPKLAP